MQAGELPRLTGARRPQRRLSSHVRLCAQEKLRKQLGQRACSDRALALFRTHEEPRSIVQSRTIERRVLVTICGRRRSHQDDRGAEAGPVVDGTRETLARARGLPPSTRGDAARSVSLVEGHSGVSADEPRRNRARHAAETGSGQKHADRGDNMKQGAHHVNLAGFTSC